ncbi:MULTISPECIES: hypothetical protein [unclassified Coleofasciculus]|uniref:hypothetical protein n=1 Tax=Coleofasciculus sp. LEGE 07081 TaxID=2777967 RepID=UPI001D15837C
MNEEILPRTNLTSANLEQADISRAVFDKEFTNSSTVTDRRKKQLRSQSRFSPSSESIFCAI